MTETMKPRMFDSKMSPAPTRLAMAPPMSEPARPGMSPLSCQRTTSRSFWRWEVTLNRTATLRSGVSRPVSRLAAT